MRTATLSRSERSAQRFLRSAGRAESMFRELGFRHAPRRHNPNVGNLVESLTAVLYDQVTFAQSAAFTKTVLFQTPIGQSGKTLAQTNMTFPGVLPNPYRFTIYALAVHIANNTIPADMQNLLTNVSFSLFVNTKPYQQGPLAVFPAGRGWKLDAAANVGTVPAGSAPIFSTGNGVPDPRAVFTLDIPLTIEQGEQFSVVLNPETAFNLTA